MISTDSRNQHYNHIASQNKAQNSAAYRQWVISHSPKQIRDANNARRQLAQKKKKGSKSPSPIRDERVVRQPESSYLFFYNSRWKTGDFKGIPVREAAKLASQEWKALSAAEKQVGSVL